MVPLVQNTELFKEFLSKLGPEDINDPAQAQLLGDVIANLSKTISICFDPNGKADLSPAEKAMAEQAGEDALRTFDTLDSEYARLGLDAEGLQKSIDDISPELTQYLRQAGGGDVPPELDDEYTDYQANVTKLRVYKGMSSKVDYWGRNLLPEYLVAEQGQYLTPPDEKTYGPSDWQKDGGQSRWSDAISFLGQLERDERTKPFAAEVRDGLVASLDAALSDIDTKTEKPYWAPQREDLANVRDAILGQPHDVERLQKYIQKPDYQ